MPHNRKGQLRVEEIHCLFQKKPAERILDVSHTKKWQTFEVLDMPIT